MGFKDWALWERQVAVLLVIIGLMVLLGILVIIGYHYQIFTIGQADDKTYQLLPIAFPGKLEEYPRPDDLLKDESGKVIGIKFEALQRMAGAQPFTLAELARLFEALVGDEDTLEIRSIKQSLAALTKKTLLADESLVEQLKGQPGSPGRAGKDGKVDQVLVSELIDKALARRPVSKETVQVISSDKLDQQIAGLRAELEAVKVKLAELEKRLNGLTVIKRTRVTGGAKIRIGGDDE